MLGRFTTRRTLIGVVGAATTSLLAAGLTTWALANPAPAVMIPEAASATRFIGLAFDTCAAPKRAVMKTWKESSPYGAVGIYISGGNRACDQSNLTADWIGDVTAQGWKFIPLDVGLQAPCADRTKHPMSRDLDTAYQQGRRAGNKALAAAASLGLQPGSALYSDIESFNQNDAGCVDAVRSYVSGWTIRLHRNGYLAGVYGSLQSTVRQLSASHSAENLARPDVVWSAQWDGSAELTGWGGVPDQQWAAGQRVKQYIGDHNETYGGYTLNIDTNAIDAPVATVAQPFPVAGMQAASLHAGPGFDRTLTRSLTTGSTVNVVCQIGTPAGKWDKLADGTWVADTSVAGGVAKPSVPPCSVPFQVSPQWAWTRSGPGTEFVEDKPLYAGTLAWIQCETPGVTLGRPGYWASLAGGGWMSGAVLARPYLYQRSIGVPLCELPASSAPPAATAALSGPTTRL
jgi:hypothetical protein